MILLIPCHNIILDINECTEETDECEEHCYNSIGGYYCNCTGSGYRLHSDGNACESKYTKYKILRASLTLVYNTCL